MQGWKIKRMSVKTLERWLDSVDKLLLHYLGAKGIDMACCSLCWASNERNNLHKKCDDCLWQIIERKTCATFRDELYSKESDLTVSELRRFPKLQIHARWKNARIKQLERWRCVIVGELAGRYAK